MNDSSETTYLQNRENKLYKRNRSCSLVLFSISMVIYVLSVILIAVQPKWFGLVATHIIIYMQLAAFILCITFLALTISNVTSRGRCENKLLRGAGYAHSRDTFWDAFPFASIVFFLVTVFMLIDVIESTPDKPPEQIILKVAFYLVAALVTSVIVLFGAHLVKFESKISALTDNVEEAADKAVATAGKANDVVVEAKVVADKATLASVSARDAASKTERFLASANNINRHLQELASSAGLSILALRSDSNYRKAAYSIPSTKYLDRYIAARSSQALMSDEAICLGADQQVLKRIYFPTARNMISSFLQEMAWDLGERHLVTNSRNYTTFLVGAARGFEEVMSNMPPKDRKKHRIFYLTHTLVSPAHLLNWPKVIADKAIDVDYALCQVTPFMFDYMTYCRYFAAKKDVYIHGRMFRTQRGRTGRNFDDQFALKPTVFGCEAFKHPKEVYKLPTLVNRWGIPLWGQINVDTNELSLYDREHKPNINVIHAITDELAEYIFASVPAKTREIKGPKQSPQNPLALFWPLYHEKNENDEELTGDLRSVAGLSPNIEDIKSTLCEFLLSDKIEIALDSYYSNMEVSDLSVREINLQKKDIIVRDYKAFQKIIAKIKSSKSTTAADSLLGAYENILGARWGFHGREGLHSALNVWEDVETVIMLLVNVFLAEAHQGSEELAPFLPWFSEMFHSTPELSRYYRLEDKNLSADIDKIDTSKSLKDEEFALIGMVKMPDGEVESKDIHAFLVKHLDNWANQRRSNIKCVMGVKSSIQFPWKHSEIAWLWPCANGLPELQDMVRYYKTILENSPTVS